MGFHLIPNGFRYVRPFWLLIKTPWTIVGGGLVLAVALKAAHVYDSIASDLMAGK